METLELDAPIEVFDPDFVVEGDLEPLVIDAEPAPATGTLDTLVIEAEPAGAEGAVFGTPLAENPLMEFATGGTTVLGGAELRRKLGATLGETLAGEPGITASSYSPGVSRPIIRGFEGVRVRTLRDGLGTMDLSQDSPDHGVLVDTLMAEAVEIHRGPASLLYGNSAIGGAINTRTRYIPPLAGGEPLSAAAIAGYETQGDGHFYSVTGEGRSKHAAFGFSASVREADDISIPGRARTERYDEVVMPRIFVPGVGEVELPNPDGFLPNSHHRQQSLSFGGRFGSEDGLTLGISHHRFDTTYGIPFVAGDSTDFFGEQSIDAALDRTDLELGWKPEVESWLRGARLRLGHGDYRHEELFEGRGKDLGNDFVETAFDKETAEGRLEIIHGSGDFNGVIGVHAIDEALEVKRLVVPPPTPFEEISELDSEGLGIFTLQKWRRGGFSIQAGLRWEHSEVAVTDQLGSRLDEIGSSFSQSLAAGYEWLGVPGLDLLSVTLTGSHIERLPTAIERYAFYDNAALGRFLIGGDLDGEPLELESSRGLELALRAERGDTAADLAFFFYDFHNYVYLQDQRGISFAPTAMYVETPAEFYGIEAALTHRLWEGAGALDGRIFGDIMRGIDRERDEPLPRVPAARLGGGLVWESERWSAGIDARFVFNKTQVAQFPTPELPTENYWMIDAAVSWRPLSDPGLLELTLRARNLLDEEARDHTSFRKDTVPLAGLGIGAEMRWRF